MKIWMKKCSTPKILLPLKKNKPEINSKSNIMKFKAITILLMLFCFVGFAQKKEIRDAEKALESGNFNETINLLQPVESQVSSLNDSYKGRYYFYLGTALALRSAGTGSLDDVRKANDYLNLATKLGKEEEANKSLEMIYQGLINAGVQDQNAGNYKGAYEKLHTLYEINSKDTLYLLAAANNAYNAQLDEKAIQLYEQLRDMGYKGNSLEYVAVEKSTGKEEVFANASTRDLYVQSGEYIKPSVRRTPSREGDIIKQLAFLYLRNDQKDKALGAIEQAKKGSHDDIHILKAEAIIYQEMGEDEKLHGLLHQLIRKDPDGAATYYMMLGDAAIKKRKEDSAKELFEKAIKADPTSLDAYNNMANIYLTKQEAIVNEMNTLGMSKADTKRYDQLSEERNNLLKKALPYIEKIYEIDPENLEVVQSLYQLHSQLRNRDEAQKYKSILDETK